MTPEQKFSRWVRTTLALFFIMFIYFIVADTWMPQTPESTVMRVVTPISSRVSGYVSHIYVHNNSVVKKGDRLFDIDARPYQNTVEGARIAWQQANQDNQQLDAQIAAGRARLHSAQIEAENAGRTWRRYKALRKGNLVSQQEIDNAFASWQSGLANVSNLQAALQQQVIARGAHNANNIALQKFTNQLHQAQLDLGYTQVVADSDGVISNLQLKEGWYANAGTPALALVNDKIDIVADFREKSLTHTRPGTPADVVFDGRPGEVFKAHVVSQDAGVLPGQQAVNGQLSAPEESNRWVRDAQRMRIHLALDDADAPVLPAGARATVQLYNSGSRWAALFSRLQITVVSYLHYVY